MIPKKIHYCWFGRNPLPKEVKEYIKSWKKYCPDYEIIEWNEENYNVKKCKFLEEAYKEKKWAFVSDYARLDIIYNNGGIYLDTDVEVIKSLDSLLQNEAFMGFENGNRINTGIGFGANKHNKIIKENLEYYNSLDTVDFTGNLGNIICNVITTNILKKHGLVVNDKKQIIENVVIYPTEFMCPMDYETGNIEITKNTYTIHHYSMSWLDKRDKNWHRIQQKLSRVIGIKAATKIVRLSKKPGNAIKKIRRRLRKCKR